MVTNLVTPEDFGSHWYWQNGQPAYLLPNKGDPSKVHKATLRDAKEFKLYPSVTSIMQMVYKRQLEAWKASQYILSAITLPKRQEEAADQFAMRVISDARLESQRAADFGSDVHSMVEQYLNGELPEVLGPGQRGYIDGFMRWAEKNPVEPLEMEMAFANHTWRYGGRLDFWGYVNGIECIVDWKTQKTKPGKAIVFYPEWAAQLKAYKVGIDNTSAFLCSVAISSTEPGRVESHIWLDEEWPWVAYQSALNLYYTPLGPGYELLNKFDSIEGDELDVALP